MEISKVHEDLNSVAHDVNKSFEVQARQIASLEKAQQEQMETVAIFAKFAQDIGAAKAPQLFETEANGDSLTAEQSPPPRPSTMHETYLANIRKGFSSTPFVPTSKTTRLSFGAT